MKQGYQGDVTVGECWSHLQSDADAFLVDVRTTAEWDAIGVPDLSSIGRSPLFIEWQTYPTMAIDPDFVEKLEAEIAAAGGSKASRLMFLCRSGSRSMGSAAAMTAAGYADSYNILGGFEGPPDATGQRGTVAGWQAEGLPWRRA
ncbi:rhodanese-like domain-containing protein [Mangrovibrevibacter kandeliae]|uniref:rhodanese-like domain-containing protein n=1 Tax=Mangrovibrevibacter kandeliae TaxID=2968473 RepID=UPI0021176EF6|nr:MULTISPECIES: rhodanese-like domain-containing protein [unclassified Aurantimonas]MCQ8782998.1 rhodanese-like domain-containing protein [Aurantimonas sp. CSK15Z-1]MCW4115810.1 rhodanese-like domain-containing protein [Aurantimonas sp. MSK8Z-1]